MAKRGISNNCENLDRCAFYSRKLLSDTHPPSRGKGIYGQGRLSAPRRLWRALNRFAAHQSEIAALR